LNVTILNQYKLLNKPILAICPTRERIEKCNRMLNSFEEMRGAFIDIIFCIDEDDPNLKEYEQMFQYRAAYVISRQMNITQLFNRIVNEMPSYKMFHQTNDDFVYITKRFDKEIYINMLHNGSGIYYGDDDFWGKEICVSPFITSDIIRALGWIQMPKLTHLCSDLVWMEIGEALDILHYMPEVCIKHIHPETTGEARDSVTDRVNSPEMYQKDKIQFVLWKNQRSQGDIDKVRKAIRRQT